MKLPFYGNVYDISLQDLYSDISTSCDTNQRLMEMHVHLQVRHSEAVAELKDLKEELAEVRVKALLSGRNVRNTD